MGAFPTRGFLCYTVGTNMSVRVRMKRRMIRQLERRVANAKTRAERARAFYRLGIFHDENSRGEEAISNYEKALHFGLRGQIKARALAWLAFRLYKIERRKEAQLRVVKALALARDVRLKRFLLGLNRKIERVDKL